MDGGASLAEIFNRADIKKCETNGIFRHVQTSYGVNPSSISKEIWVPSWS
jgi:hypothetical protein